MSIWSTPNRFRLSSQALIKKSRDDPYSLTSFDIGKVAFVEIKTLSLRPLMALPSISSAAPVEYTLAVSKRLTPASRQRSTIRVASSTCVLPQALKNALPPPKVPVPKLKTGTRIPERPSVRNSMRSRCTQPENDLKFSRVVIFTRDFGITRLFIFIFRRNTIALYFRQSRVQFLCGYFLR